MTNDKEQMTKNKNLNFWSLTYLELRYLIYFMIKGSIKND